MSSFYCEVCGVECIDTPKGYLTGCEHHPADVLAGDGPAKDAAQEFAERAAEKWWHFYGFAWGRSIPPMHEEKLATLIANELRAGGWIQNPKRERRSIVEEDEAHRLGQAFLT